MGVFPHSNVSEIKALQTLWVACPSYSTWSQTLSLTELFQLARYYKHTHPVEHGAPISAWSVGAIHRYHKTANVTWHRRCHDISDSAELAVWKRSTQLAAQSTIASKLKQQTKIILLYGKTLVFRSKSVCFDTSLSHHRAICIWKGKCTRLLWRFKIFPGDDGTYLILVFYNIWKFR